MQGLQGEGVQHQTSHQTRTPQLPAAPSHRTSAWRVTVTLYCEVSVSHARCPPSWDVRVSARSESLMETREFLAVLCSGGTGDCVGQSGEGRIKLNIRKSKVASVA